MPPALPYSFPPLLPRRSDPAPQEWTEPAAPGRTAVPRYLLPDQPHPERTAGCSAPSWLHRMPRPGIQPGPCFPAAPPAAALPRIHPPQRHTRPEIPAWASIITSCFQTPVPHSLGSPESAQLRPADHPAYTSHPTARAAARVPPTPAEKETHPDSAALPGGSSRPVGRSRAASGKKTFQ